MRTHMPKASEIEQRWLVVDAADQVLGRLASEVARLLRGKHKPTYTPHLDTGDFVVVLNASRVQMTGNKLEDKTYYRQSGRPGSIKSESAREAMEKHPEEVIRRAVQGMLPKNALGRKMLSKLKVYKGTDHPHAAQAPTVHSIGA